MEMNKISNEMHKSVRTRTITAIILALITVPCLVLGGWFFIAYVGIATIMMTYEFLHISSAGKKYPLWFNLLIYIGVFALVFWVFTDARNENGIVKINEHFFDGVGFRDISVSTLGLAFYTAMIFLFVLLSEKIDIMQACYIITMSVFISICLQSILFLRNCPQYLYSSVINQTSDNTIYSNHFQQCFLLLFCAGGALVNDIYAFFVGILFGKHKLNPRISPKKTWEGFIGGVILTAITGIIFSLLMDLNGIPLLKGILDIEHWYFCVLFSFLIPITSVLGDFTFSAIKRHFNVKDYSNLLPGHGGLLDRFDSVLMTCFICSVLILFIAYNPLMKLGN